MKEINDKLYSRKEEVLHWVDSKLESFNLIYSSQDIRYSGVKIVPVDVNYFPAGFNNLSDLGIELAKEKIALYLAKFFPACDKVTLVAENFSRNVFYLKNIDILKSIFESVGKEVNIVTFAADITEELAFPVLQNVDESNLIVLNNDLTFGIPNNFDYKEYNNITPPVVAGWFNRSKYNYFKIYKEIVTQFCSCFSLDEFLFLPISYKVENLDFKHKVGLENLVEQTDKLLEQIKEEYKQREINQEPYVIIKSDHGTFGMAIMKVRNAEEILNINKKARHSMNKGKGGVSTRDVLIQEGVSSKENYMGHVAESMIYCINKDPVSLIYRYHHEKNKQSILNTTGMQFTEAKLFNSIDKNYFLHYLVSKLSLLAAKDELDFLNP